MAVFLNCVKCYEEPEHQTAYEVALDTGCDPAIADLSSDMYRKPQIARVYNANTDEITPGRGSLAGCGFAVHHLKAYFKQHTDALVNIEDYVDDLVAETVQGTAEEAARQIDSFGII